MSASTGPVALRDHPYPYAAMLTVCSDLDETLDEEVYLETIRYLCSTQETGYGPGLGLELGNSMYFDMPPGHFSYWSASEGARAQIRALMRSGHIDSLHSFGDLAKRAEAERAIEELVRHDCRIEVFIDHAVAPTNFGHDIMQGEGDVAGAPAFHADLSIPYGIRYVWCGRVTSMIGQNVGPSLRGIARLAAPLASARTVAKEGAKRLLGGLGKAKYRPHAANRVLMPRTLATGQRVAEFLRANPHWGGVSVGETGEGLGTVLSSPMLETLIARRGVAVLYTHLGKGTDRARPLGERTRASLRALAARQAAGHVLVTSTAKLLQYVELVESLEFSAAEEAGECRIEVRARGPAPSLEGLTFFVQAPERTRLSVDGREIALRANPPDASGRASVSVPWRPNEYPL